MITTFYGYLEAAYLLAPYLSAFATGAVQSQIDLRIESSFTVKNQIQAQTHGTREISQQLDRRIVADETIPQQIDQRIQSGSSVHGQLQIQTGGAAYVKQQIDGRIESINLTRQQLDMRIASGSKTIRGQLDQQNVFINAIFTQLDRLITTGSAVTMGQEDRRIASSSTIMSQLDRRVVSSSSIRSQADKRITSGSKLTRQELGRGPVSHQTCDGYLTGPYLSEPYLAPFICAHLRQQISHRLAKTTTVSQQLDRRIDSGLKVIRQQMERRIEDEQAIRMQLLRTSAVLINSQLLISIYNTTNLRILSDFPSRGTSGTNWSVVAGGTAAGDRGVNNLNTDIVEEVYRSTATTVTLQCDTEISQGIFLDTLAILGHNFTTSAVVVLQGSNDITFSSIPLSETLTVETENMYYIAPSLPLTSYRYWRIVVSDVTNTDGYIQIGTIVFGSSIIFNGECFTDEVVRKKTHFADRIRTEGYSSVSNDRALKRGLSLRFQKLNYNRENYENLTGVIDTARTSLKCLWIPTPEYASRFAVFGKLAEMPVETHKAISANADYIDMDITVDEAL
jgi:hypothetical protein